MLDAAGKSANFERTTIYASRGLGREHCWSVGHVWMYDDAIPCSAVSTIESHMGISASAKLDLATHSSTDAMCAFFMPLTIKVFINKSSHSSRCKPTSMRVRAVSRAMVTRQHAQASGNSKLLIQKPNPIRRDDYVYTEESNRAVQ